MKVKVHLGCNNVRLDGFMNVDSRPTSATTLVHHCCDVSFAETGQVEIFYSNAFFEHLRIGERLPLLRDMKRALAPDGVVLFTGIPDFEAVARCYLEGAPGNVSPRFDLHEVYRYTHGDPEGNPGVPWEAQLHRGLFDIWTIEALLDQAQFPAWRIFSYAFGEEPNETNLGFCAWKEAPEAGTISVFPRSYLISANIRPETFRRRLAREAVFS